MRHIRKAVNPEMCPIPEKLLILSPHNEICEDNVNTTPLIYRITCDSNTVAYILWAAHSQCLTGLMPSKYCYAVVSNRDSSVWPNQRSGK